MPRDAHEPETKVCWRSSEEVHSYAKRMSLAQIPKSHKLVHRIRFEAKSKTQNNEQQTTKTCLVLKHPLFSLRRSWLTHCRKTHLLCEPITATTFEFQRKKWYHIDLQVTMNSSKDAKDGRAALYIDGVKLVEANGLRLKGTNDAGVDIDKFLFSTFYSGEEPDWAPEKTNYIYFDNVTVKKGI